MLGWLFAVLGLAYWLWAAYAVWQTVRRVEALGELTLPAPPRWPKVSIIIPACNEADTLPQAMRAKLEDTYPALELILIDDRSTDGTAQLVDDLAKQPRVKALHVTALPDGWLGKLHAMQVGLTAASGEYLLFSDADVHLSKDALTRAISYCEANGVDHLALLPTIRPASPLLAIVTANFIRMILMMARPWRVPDPRSTASMGVGAFNLVRRAALEKAGGLGPLKLEVADDFAIGQAVKDGGGKSVVLWGRGVAWLQFYATLGEFVRSAQKGATAFDFSFARALASAVVLTALECAPLLALVWSGTPRLLGQVGVTLALFSQLAACAAAPQALWSAFFFPVGALVNGYATARAGWLAAREGGMRWRTTFYPAQALREGRRVRFPWERPRPASPGA